MDEFARHDIPDSIDYVLKTTGKESLSYVGFSQGTAQAFAALSVNSDLNKKIDVFIALAPAMSPRGLHNRMVDAFVKANPASMYFFFGRRAILAGAPYWQSLIYPPLYVNIIDYSLTVLFDWRGKNISKDQKAAAYPHLYSSTSTKSIVHWFQIMRNKTFQLYNDHIQGPLFLGGGSKDTKVQKFPTKNIKTPIALVYGGSDSLVDINVMLKELPERTTFATEVRISL
jgi:lysosomal acid lipase/cholesteryl ester hydrolase